MQIEWRLVEISLQRTGPWPPIVNRPVIGLLDNKGACFCWLANQKKKNENISLKFIMLVAPVELIALSWFIEVRRDYSLKSIL